MAPTTVINNIQAPSALACTRSPFLPSHSLRTDPVNVLIHMAFLSGWQSYVTKYSLQKNWMPQEDCRNLLKSLNSSTFTWTFSSPRIPGQYNVISLDHKVLSYSARHFSNQCNIYKVAKVIHGNQSDDHSNWSHTRPSMLLTELY